MNMKHNFLKLTFQEVISDSGQCTVVSVLQNKNKLACSDYMDIY